MDIIIDEIDLFNDLIDFYENLIKDYDNNKKLLSSCLEKKSYERVNELDSKIQILDNLITKMKTILKINCLDGIKSEILKWEVEYKKQQDYAESAWKSYGSELAGDFNREEVIARKKLQLLKDIII